MNQEIGTKIEESFDNEEVQKIMNKASRSFSGQLSKDEITTCHLNALWKAHQHYKPNGGAKFFTYLYKGVVIECLRELKFNSKYDSYRKIHSNIPENRDYQFDLELQEEINQMPEREMILDRLSGMSIKEIAEKHSQNRETARRKIKKSLIKLANRIR